jgi:hypothetical protein
VANAGRMPRYITCGRKTAAYPQKTFSPKVPWNPSGRRSTTLAGFAADPADTTYQRGYLAALTEFRNWIENDTPGIGTIADLAKVQRGRVVMNCQIFSSR